MEHILDIETEVFEEIKEHKRTEMDILKEIRGAEVKQGDTLKLYHPGDETEALRVEITEIVGEGGRKEKERGKESGGKDRKEREPRLIVRLMLLEWMCRLETELDELLREEEAWMKGIF